MLGQYPSYDGWEKTDKGSDPSHDSYHPYGLELVPGLVEIITFASTRDGERHQHLKDNIGEIAVHCWKGPDYIEDEDDGCGRLRVDLSCRLVAVPAADICHSQLCRIRLWAQYI